MVTIIVAYNEKFVIGNNQGLVPWHIPDDLKYFKNKTMGNVCVMGRKTWDSIPLKYRPLPGRQNVILTSDPEKFMEQNPRQEGEWNVHVSNDLATAIEWAKTEWLGKEIFITGGAQIYKAAIEQGLVDRVLASEIKNHQDVEGAAFFPDLKELGWIGEVIEEFPDFSVVEYTPEPDDTADFLGWQHHDPELFGLP